MNLNKSYFLLFFSILVLVTISLLYWYRNYFVWVIVDDASIAAEIVTISSSSEGIISSRDVNEHSPIVRGELLGKVDDRVLRLEYETLNARYNTENSRLENLEREIEIRSRRIEIESDIEQSDISKITSQLDVLIRESEYKRNEFERNARLLTNNLTSENEIDRLRFEYENIVGQVAETEIALNQARQQYELTRYQINDLELLEGNIQTQRNILMEISSEMDELSYLIDETEIYSPIDGIIDRKYVEDGERVNIGQRIFAIHNLDNLWVEANIEETDIADVGIDSEVIIRVDAFPGRELEGKISSISRSTNNQFAIISNLVPSGNFIKVVQRIHVRIEILSDNLPLLSPGMMVVVYIRRN